MAAFATAGTMLVIAMILLPSCRAETMANGLPLRNEPINGLLRINPQNPRYFMDNSGRAIYLTGSHTWDNLQDWGSPTPDFDYQGYIDFLQTYYHNFIRLWAWDSSSAGGGRIALLPWQRKGPGIAADGGLTYDLGTFNQEYFDRLRKRVQNAGDRGIYVSIMLFSPVRYSTWQHHPFNMLNNSSGIDGDTNRDGSGNETQTLANPFITSIQEAYVRKVVDTVNDLDNVLYEIGNELDRETLQWQNHFIRFIRDYERTKPKQHPIGMTTSGRKEAISNAELFQSAADWISPRVEPGQDYATHPPASSGRKIVITDTDHLEGVLGTNNAKTARSWVWKSFMTGLNPIVMDPVQNGIPRWGDADWNNPKNPALVSFRQAMGQTRYYSRKIDLGDMLPHGDLSSSGFCLANPGSEYLVYMPEGKESLLQKAMKCIGSGTTVSLDLSGTTGSFRFSWFSPETGGTIEGGTAQGGQLEKFRPPFKGDAVLHVYR